MLTQNHNNKKNQCVSTTQQLAGRLPYVNDGITGRKAACVREMPRPVISIYVYFVLFFGSGANVGSEQKIHFILPASNAHLVMLTSKRGTDRAQRLPSTL